MATLDGVGKPFGMAVAPGAAATADITPISGIDTADSLVAVRHISADLVTNADVTAEASITGADTVQLSTTDTSGAFVVVVWQEDE